MAGARVCTGAPTTGFNHGACDQNAPGVIVTPGVIATVGPTPPGLSGADILRLGTLGSDNETGGTGTSTPGESGIPGERGIPGEKSGGP